MARIAFWRLGDSGVVQPHRRTTWGTPEARSSGIGQRDVLSAAGLRVVSYAKRNLVTRGVTILVADLAQQSAEMARRDERMIAAHKMPRIVLCRQDGPGSSWHVCGLPGPRQAAWVGHIGLAGAKRKPRRPCRGWDCLCRGDYRTRTQAVPPPAERTHRTRPCFSSATKRASTRAW
ncbi:MAG: hypothetical protein KatS3mg038_0827 [Candidatus Kapaibacterium sp.]|nr:MAG: hypothetical protein KatS3mg038_0827 [Candidatus Kapabacteria bacterium]